MTESQRHLLAELKASKEGGAFALACDGFANWKDAHKLETLGLAEWKGDSFGSKFWAITDKGMEWVE